MSAQLMHLIKLIKYCWSYVKSLLWYEYSSALIRLTRITGTNCITRQTHSWKVLGVKIICLIVTNMLGRVSFWMVENQRNLCRFPDLNNANFLPSKMELVLAAHCLMARVEKIFQIAEKCPTLTSFSPKARKLWIKIPRMKGS